MESTGSPFNALPQLARWGRCRGVLDEAEGANADREAAPSAAASGGATSPGSAGGGHRTIRAALIVPSLAER